MSLTLQKVVASRTAFYRISKLNNFLIFQLIFIIIPCQAIVAGYYDITLAVRVSVCLSVHPSVVCPSVYSFLDDNLSKCQWIFTRLGVCFDRSGLGLLMGKFRQFLTELTAQQIRIFISI